MTNKREVFSNFINFMKTEEQTFANIIMHYMPDPDSMASAFVVQKILEVENIDSKIFYSGEISHPQNKTMLNLLGLTLFKETELDPKEKINICVDCTPKNSCVDKAQLIIDHHNNPIKDVQFVINDPKFGSCSTIVWEMFQEEINWESNEEMATALLLGIRTDTKDLVSENMCQVDFQAYQFLIDYVDKERVQKIMNYPVPRYVYDKRLILLKEGNSLEKNGIFIGGVGYIPASQRDVISILSDDYLRMEGIHTAVIFCITDERQMEVSIRSNNTTVDVNELCDTSFGQFGGGKVHKGGAKVPLNFWANLNEESKDMFWRMTCEQMFKSILKEDY